MVTANDVKIKGINCFEKALANQAEVVITVRGKQRYVVMKLEQYHHLRELELEAALLEVKQEVADGRTINTTIDEHVKAVFN